MSEIQNNRRQQAQKELGLDNTEEQLQIEDAIQKEEQRQMKSSYGVWKLSNLHLIEPFKV